MERSEIVPHLSWSGPQPRREVDAYLLAMLVRVHASGLDDDAKCDPLQTPSVLTTENLEMVAVMYAFYRQRMEESGARSIEDMLNLVHNTGEDDVEQWSGHNEEAIRRAEAELLEFVDTAKTPGFRCFG